MPLRDPHVLLNPLFHVRCSHGRHADPLHFQRRARPLNICCFQRRGETTKWWSVKRGDSWNNPRLGKEKRLRRTKLAVSARSRRTGWAETGQQANLGGMKVRDVSRVSSACWQEHGGITNSTKSPYIKPSHWLFCASPYWSSYLAGLDPLPRNKSNYF